VYVYVYVLERNGETERVSESKSEMYEGEEREKEREGVYFQVAYMYVRSGVDVCMIDYILLYPIIIVIIIY